MTDLNIAFTQINGLAATAGYTNVSATALDGQNPQDGINRTDVINISSGLQVSSRINITGDAGDVFVMRWDTDANAAHGYRGQVKFQSGGAIVPLGGLTAGNFIHVAGDINSSGGGSNPAAPYPQGPRLDDDQQVQHDLGYQRHVGADDFVPTPALTNGKNNGDTNVNVQFDAGETWYHQGSLVATAPGVLTNLASATVGSTSVTDTATVNIVRPLATSKFFVVDSNTDKVYGYNKFGATTGDQALSAANSESLGITGDTQGTTLWVLDRNKNVYVSTTSGVAQGSWTATDVSTSPEGIARDGNHLWMVDSSNKVIY